MLPVLFTVSGFSVSTFGVFLLLSILVATYLIWKLGMIEELNVERILDIVLISLIGGFIGARAYYILFHLPEFNSFWKVILINKYPGLSFWGGLIGGYIALKLISNRFKINFWQVLDLAIIGVFIAIPITSIGCLLSSCQVGLPTNSFLGVSQIGYLGKRFPLQIFEALLFILFFYSLWKKSLKFHPFGYIAYKGLLILGVLKFILEFLRGDTQKLLGPLTLGHLWALILFSFGVIIYHRLTKKTLTQDLKFITSLFTNSGKRKLVVSRIYRNWYNLFVSLKFSIQRWPKKMAKLLNIKSNPQRF